MQDMTDSIDKLATSKATKVSAAKKEKTSIPHLHPLEEVPLVDGRHHRSMVTRHKIVEALTALIREGELVPTAEQVALRASVGLRTVFRHFDDMDTLYREVASSIDAVVMPEVNARFQASSWQERLLESVARRGALYDRIAAFHLASQIRRHESAYLDAVLVRSARYQRDLLCRLLPAKVMAKAPLVEGLVMLQSIDTWVCLRREQGLSADDAMAVIRQATQALIAGLD
jgi:AcrR family transcriptional regulator